MRPITAGTFMRQACYRAVLASFLAVSVLCADVGAQATTFIGVAAGDPTEEAVVLWTRAVAAGAPGHALALTLQLAAEPGFRTVLRSVMARTVPERDGVLKMEVSGLPAGQRFYYRFVAPDAVVSPVGSFRTAPSPQDCVRVSFAFSGDADGRWRPYPLLAGFGARPESRDLDFFVYLGDTLYETASQGSPAAADPFTDPQAALADYRRKYRENLEPLRPGGHPGLRDFYAAQANYTLLDNHELGNRQFQSGGAPAGDPPGHGVDPGDPANDINPGPGFINQTPTFRALMQAYKDYQPVRERRLGADALFAADPRSLGTDRLYLAQRWGCNMVFINADDRSYRDIRLRRGLGDDTGARADNRARTMLGATQLAWLKAQLLQAQREGVRWKVLALSSPLDQVGAIGSGRDSGKSWSGGYRAERSDLLRFIVEQRIEHVLVLSTDDHLNRVNELTYAPDPARPAEISRVPGAFTIVAGPLGAGGPDGFPGLGFPAVRAAAAGIANAQRQAGVDPLGLDPTFPGLRRVRRAGHPEADQAREPADFYSPDTFNFVRLDIDADGTLHVATHGIRAQSADSHAEPSAQLTPEFILGFDIVPEEAR